jgi:CBS domain containing-hemolysin-like protein
LGANYWRQLAPITALFLRWLILLLYPFVVLSKKLTGSLAHENTLTGFSRDEFAALAELGVKEGKLEGSETRILRNLLLLRDMPVKEVMTPRLVVFSLDQKILISDFCENYHGEPFSRIPIYDEQPENVTGFVLRSELILAQVNGEGNRPLKDYQRDILALTEVATLLSAFELLVAQRSHLALVVDEYGGVDGLLTLEDIFETLLGLEITDELDKTADMQQLARRFGRRRARALGVDSSPNKK